MDEITFKKTPKPNPEELWYQTMEGLIYEGKPHIAQARLFEQDELYEWLKSIHTDNLFDFKNEIYERFWVDDRLPAYSIDAPHTDDELGKRMEKVRLYLQYNYPDFEAKMTAFANSVYRKKDEPLRKKFLARNEDFNASMLSVLILLHQDLQHINQIYRRLYDIELRQEVHIGVCEYSYEKKPPFAFDWIRHCLCCYRNQEQEGAEGLFHAPKV